MLDVLSGCRLVGDVEYAARCGSERFKVGVKLAEQLAGVSRDAEQAGVRHAGRCRLVISRFVEFDAMLALRSGIRVSLS